jgi:Ni/Fe-hydrogenase subunit HybB-like protein
MHVLSRLSRLVAPILAVYLGIKISDMFIRETFHYLAVLNTQSVMFMIEVIVGGIVPLFMFMNRKRLKNPKWLFSAASLVIFGVVMNRINNFVIAYKPPYSPGAYYPSIGEISVTVGFIALLVLVYRACVMIFPVISQPITDGVPEKHYKIGEIVK